MGNKCCCIKSTARDIGGRNYSRNTKFIKSVTYPTEDEWYSCSKTSLPKYVKQYCSVNHILTEDKFIKLYDIQKRSISRIKYDKCSKTRSKSKADVIVTTFDGIKTVKKVTTGVSKESIKWFESFMDKYDIDIEHYCNTGYEKVIELHNNKITKVDGWCKDLNMVFEYHGGYFHGDPDKYERNSTNTLSKTRFGKLFVNTKNRDVDILLSEYNLCTIWGTGKNKVVTFYIIKLNK